MVATRVVPATASFYSARGIGSQLSAGAAVDEELRRAGKTFAGTERAVSKRQNLQALGEAIPLLYMFVINCFGIEMVLCDLYLKTKGWLFDTFIITVWFKLHRCDDSVLEFESFSPLMNW